MDSVLIDFSAAALTRAVEANFEDLYRRFAAVPGADVVDDPTLLRVCTGIPETVLNGVMCARLSGADVDARIEETVEYFRSRRLPMMWVVGPSSRPESASLGT